MKINLGTQSLARAAARRPWLTVGIWAGILVLAFLSISLMMGGVLTNDNKMLNQPEAVQAQNILDSRLGKSDNINETVIVQSSTLTVDDPQFKSQVTELQAQLIGLGDQVVVGAVNYYETGDPSMISADRHSTIIAYAMPKGGDKNIEQVYQLTDKITAAGTFTVYETGNGSFNHDANILAEDTMKTGEVIGIAVALVVLAIVFGAVVAAFLPIILGVVAIIVALGVTAVLGHAMDLMFMVTNMITMMGLAVGIDYSLFVLTRFREERAHGVEKVEAIAIAGGTASRAVLFSGLTVMLALTSLVIFPLTIFQTMGIGSILVVFVAVLATLTLLPAILSLFGDRVNSLRIPFIQSRQPQPFNANRGFWANTTRIVTRLPVVSMLVVVIILAAAAVPFFSKNSGMSGISGLPDDLRAKQGFNFLQQNLHTGMDSPAFVVIDGATGGASTQSALTALQVKIGTDPIFTGTKVVVYPDKNLTVMSIGITGDPLSQAAMDSVSRLRAEYIPQAFAGSGVVPMVTGNTAFILDFNQTTNEYTPYLFAFILSLSFIILMVAFRSVVIPAAAILMNMLSVGAAYGLIVLVFQKGVGAALFGFQRVDAIETWLPLFLFALLFGLSMDYHVFLLSRIREHYRQTGDNAGAVAFGLRNTGKLITGAALIMVAVFGGFAVGDMVMFEQMGFGLAVAVLVDATLIRSVLVPATMKLLGKYNWYLPQWLAWIPNVSLGENLPAVQPAKPDFKPVPPMRQLVPVNVTVEAIEQDKRDQPGTN
jgi:putative drug exporter of the RND superfamily